MAISNARGMLRCGFWVSPPIWIDCSKPSAAKMTPAESAARTPWAPYGAKPPPAVKLPLWNDVNSRAKMVVVGMSSFQIIAMLLVSASHFTPRVLMIVKNAMNSRPQRTPARVSVPVAVYTWKPVGNLASRWLSDASTSIGAMVTA